MSSTTQALGAIAPTAEQSLFGHPTSTVIMTATNAALDATLAPPAQAGPTSLMIALMYDLTLSFSAAPSAPLTLTVVDGATVIWQCEISVSSPFVNSFDFQRRPLRASPGATLHAKIGASGAAVQTISFTGALVSGP